MNIKMHKAKAIEIKLKNIKSDRSDVTELKSLVKTIVAGDTSKHYKYCPCCRNYEANEELNSE